MDAVFLHRGWQAVASGPCELSISFRQASYDCRYLMQMPNSFEQELEQIGCIDCKCRAAGRRSTPSIEDYRTHARAAVRFPRREHGGCDM